MHEKIYSFNLTKIGLRFIFVITILLSSSYLKIEGQTTPTRRSPTQPKLTLEQIAAKAGVLIDVNTTNYPESNYNISQMINNVLLSAGSYCSTNNATNVTVRPNRPASNATRSWGYFNRATTNFPFKSGLVLSTGFASYAGNTAATPDTVLGSGSDVDLATALGISYLTYDATSVEFDFVPFTNTVTFRYILASEEYGAYECSSFIDGFALLLKKVGDPTYTNLAVLPNGGGPVRVNNINPNCGSANAAYFAGYNTGQIETNYNGRTVPLTAVANVIPGQTYHFKMVLADVSDSSYDTAVFLEADSFDIGIKILDAGGLELPASITFCEESPQILTASTSIVGATFKWYYNNTLIPGATSNTYTATQAGNYRVEISIPGTSCTNSASIDLIQGAKPTLNLTDNNGTALASPLSICGNINQIIKANTNANNAVYEWYFNNTLIPGATTDTYTATQVGTYKVKVKTSSLPCQSEFKEITITTYQTPAPTITASNTIICANGTVTLTSSAATGNTWSTGATTQTITVNAAGTYTLTNTAGSCSSLPASITIVEETDPNVAINGTLSFCEGSSTTLTASATGTGLTYSWSTGATTPAITVNDSGVYTVTVTTTNGCTFTKSVTAVKNPLPTVQNATLTECTTTGTANFDLTSAQNQISTTPGVTFSYYQNQADAQAQNTNTIPTPNNFNSGNTTVYVLVKLGDCSRIAELTLAVTQNATPTITASNTIICVSGTVTLTSSAATGNTWSTGATTQTITVNAAGTYTLTNTAGSCASLPASIIIVEETDPNVAINGTLSFCDGSSTTLTASATGTGLTYSWSTGATTPAITVNDSGVYTVTVTTTNGCTFTKSVTAVKNPLPTVQNATLTECTTTGTANFDLTSAQNQISTTPGVTFSYYQNQADAQAQNTNTIPTPNNFNSGNTTVYVLVKLGDCSRIAELTLAVNGKPQPTISQTPMAICDNSSVTLTSSLPTGNTWSTGATTQSITVTAAGTYTLTNNNGLCTSDPVSVNVVSNPNPNIQISGNLNFCDGDSTTLTATASGTGNTFSWSNGSVGASTTIATSGTFTVTVTTAGGCQYTKSVTTVKDPPINITIATPTILTCSQPQTTLNATASIFQAGSTFLWTTTGGNIVSGATTLTPVVSAAGTYTLTITNPTPLACSKQASIIVTADQVPPTIVLTASQMTICKGYSVTINASGAVSYTWNNGNTGSTQTFSPTETTTYTVSGIGTNGCSSITPGTITIKVVPDITSPLTDLEICAGDTATLDAGYDPTYTYLWSTGETTQKINATQAGTYSVTITNEGCSKSFSATLSYSILPTINEVVYENGTLTIKATNNSTSPLEYSIDNGVQWQSSPVFSNVHKNMMYKIRVKNRNSTCSAETEYYTYFIPNTITPNGDGINDTVDFAEMVKFNQFDAIIYDRYGKTIFKPSTTNSVWNGTYNGRPIPTGTYWYKISWVDKISAKPVQFTGWIMIKNRE